MDDIESYEPKSSEIVDSEPGWATAYFSDDLPTAGEAVAVGPGGETPRFGVVRNRLGGRRTHVMFFDDAEEVSVGTPVERTELPAGLILDNDGDLDLRTSGIVPRRDNPRWFSIEWASPEFSELESECSALELGYRGLDLVAPIADGGVNLVIDNSNQSSAFDQLVDATVRAVEPDRTIRAPIDREGDSPPRWLDHGIRPSRRAHGHMAAVRAGVALGAALREDCSHIVAVIELPAVGRTVASPDDHATSLGYAETVDRIASGLVSTTNCNITTMLRLPIPQTQSGISSIVETLGLGDVESQIFIDEDHCFVPDRSTSNAARDKEARRARDRALEVIRLAEKARDKKALLGPEALTDDEASALERADALRTDLLASRE